MCVYGGKYQRLLLSLTLNARPAFPPVIVHYRLRSSGLRTVIVRGLRLSRLGKRNRLADRVLLHPHDPRYGDLQTHDHTRILRSGEYVVRRTFEERREGGRDNFCVDLMRDVSR